MADILSVIQQFLCYGSQPCIQEFNQYAYKPAEGIFYAVFFPIVVILLFVYIVSGAVGALRAPGFRILIGVAFFAFIILQGWYYFFILASKLWFLVLFLLGGLWFVIHTFTGKEGGGGGAKGRTIGGAMSGISAARVMRKLSGAEGREASVIKGKLDALDSIPPGGHGIGELTDEISHDLKAFAEATSVEGLPVFSETAHLYSRFEGICRKKKMGVPAGLHDAIKKADLEYKAHKN
jgi:hypothetical protein